MLRLAGCMEQLWLAGNVTEGRRRLKEALAMAPHPSRERIRALNSSAGLALLQQDHAEARRLIDEGISLGNQLGDPSGEAWAWFWAGFLELNGDPPRPDAALRSVEKHEQVGDRVGICRSLVFAGGALTQDPKTMKESLERHCAAHWRSRKSSRTSGPRASPEPFSDGPSSRLAIATRPPHTSLAR
jgi:hypothetical protein